MDALHTTNMDTSTLYFHALERQLKQEIDNLSIHQVKDDVQFLATKKRIKDHFLLSPVTIGEPKIDEHNVEKKALGYNFQGKSIDAMFSREREGYLVKISFPVTGSAQLFKYRTDGAPLPSDVIYAPVANHITVEVIVEDLDKDNILAQAEKEISTTKSLIDQNNSGIEVRSQQISAQIETLLEEKRKKTINL